MRMPLLDKWLKPKPKSVEPDPRPVDPPKLDPMKELVTVDQLLFEKDNSSRRRAEIKTDIGEMKVAFDLLVKRVEALEAKKRKRK